MYHSSRFSLGDNSTASISYTWLRVSLRKLTVFVAPQEAAYTASLRSAPNDPSKEDPKLLLKMRRSTSGLVLFPIMLCLMQVLRAKEKGRKGPRGSFEIRSASCRTPASLCSLFVTLCSLIGGHGGTAKTGRCNCTYTCADRMIWYLATPGSGGRPGQLSSWQGEIIDLKDFLPFHGSRCWHTRSVGVSSRWAIWGSKGYRAGHHQSSLANTIVI